MNTIQGTRNGTSRPVRTAIVGAGAIGGALALALVRAGHTVSVLARGATLSAIREHGIRVVESATEPACAATVHASDDSRELGEQDFVVIALKAQSLPAVAASLSPLVGARTAVVSATNG